MEMVLPVLPLVELELVLELAASAGELVAASGGKRSCTEGSRCCCEIVAFVLVAFGAVDRRPGPP